MTPHDKTIAFHQLHEIARTLRAKVDADPLRAVVMEVDTAIRVLGQFDDIIVAANQKQNELSKLTEQVTAAQKLRDDLAAEARNLEDSIEHYKVEVRRWESVLEDTRISVLAKKLQPQPRA